MAQDQEEEKGEELEHISYLLWSMIYSPLKKNLWFYDFRQAKKEATGLYFEATLL